MQDRFRILRRGEDMEDIIDRRPVRLEAVVAARIDDFDITNLRVYAIHENVEVTSIPAGASFEIHAEYRITNYRAGLTYWTTCMSVFDVTHNSPIGGDSFGMHLGGGPLSAHDAVNVIMPDEPTTFRVKIHANQIAFGGCPPESEW